MTIASVHRCGRLAAALLWCVAAVAIVVDVEVGIVLSVPVLVASMGVGDALTLYRTRRWPKVEAAVLDFSERSVSATSIRGRNAAMRYVQRLSYDHRGRRHDASLTWSTYPPSRVVLRVNPDHPSEVVCLEHVGDSWTSFVLVAFLLPLVVGVTLWLGLSRLPRFLAGLAVLGGIALVGRRLHPVDRADLLGTVRDQRLGTSERSKPGSGEVEA